MSTFSIVGIAKASFNGRNGAGTISVPGVKAGDIVIWMADTPSGESLQVRSIEFSPWVEGIITVDDEVQQTVDGNASASIFTILLIRGV